MRGYDRIVTKSQEARLLYSESHSADGVARKRVEYYFKNEKESAVF